MVIKHRRAWAAAAVAVATVLIPSQALAANGTASLPLLGGSLSIGALGSGTLPNATLGGGPVSGAINSATWSDTTGLSLGWNGTISLATPLTYQGPWTPSGAAPALTSTASGAYSGTAGNALVTITVTAGTVALTTFSWTDREAGGTTTSGSGATDANGSASTAFTNGVTVTFNAATAYAVNDVYTVHVGALPASAMVLATASATGPTATGTTASGGNLPTLQNNGVTVTGGGSAVKFVSAGLLTGMGTFTIAPGVTVSGWDPNNTWAGAGVVFSATTQYAINSGP